MWFTGNNVQGKVGPHHAAAARPRPRARPITTTSARLRGKLRAQLPGHRGTSSSTGPRTSTVRARPSDVRGQLIRPARGAGESTAWPPDTKYHYRLVAHATTPGTDRGGRTGSPDRPRPAGPSASRPKRSPPQGPGLRRNRGRRARGHRGRQDPRRQVGVARLGRRAAHRARWSTPASVTVGAHRGAAGAACRQAPSAAASSSVRQPRSGCGRVDVYLRGGSFTELPELAARHRTPRRPRSRPRPRPRRPRGCASLWGRDHGGRFRSHGRHSHATVRGTRWLTVDRCDGTLTRVTNGSVGRPPTTRGTAPWSSGRATHTSRSHA